MWPYILKADEMKPRELFSSLRRLQESVKSKTLRAGLLYRESPSSTHIEQFDTFKLPGYLSTTDYIPPTDSLVNHRSFSVYWPSAVEGPVNHKRAESMTDFLSTYLHHIHVVCVDDATVGFLQVLVSPPPMGERRQEKLVKY
jgi:hypothetical protein